MGAGGEKYSPSLVAMSPTCSQNGTSGCRPMMSWTASNSPWMSPSAPINMGRRGRKGGRGRTPRLCVLHYPALPALPAPPASRSCSRGRHQQVRLVPHEVVFAVDRQFVVFAHEDGADRACFFAITAEDAACLVDLVDGGIAGARLDAAVVLRRFEVDRVSRAGDRAQAAGDAFFQVVFVAHQDLLAAPLGEHRELLLRIVHRDGFLEQVLQRGGKAHEQRTDDGHCPQFTRPLRSM